MSFEYFLGANSSRGFYSLYSGFCSGEGDYLHIIKGGPGTGKSGFMRRIGKAAEEKGYSVEYALCSGDPDSLDAVYIPQLKKGWVDGTAPHVTEPRCFGFDSDYVNLGHFCRTPVASDEKDYVNFVSSKYKACYSCAYDYLKAFALLRKNRAASVIRPDELNMAEEKIREILDRSCSKSKGQALLVPRFLHALCCKGDIFLKSSILYLCKQYYVVRGSAAYISAVLRLAAELGSGYTSELIVSPDPVEPELFEAVLLPELSLGFVSAAFGIEGAKELATEEDTAERRFPLENEVRAMAVEKLRQAKALHDELESFYKKAMDFAALDEFTEEYIKTAME